MKKIASELLVERLTDWGVEVVFGLPGDGINGRRVRWERQADFAPWATACGGLGRRVEDPADLEGALADALAFDGRQEPGCLLQRDTRW